MLVFLQLFLTILATIFLGTIISIILFVAGWLVVYVVESITDWLLDVFWELDQKHYERKEKKEKK